MSHNEKVNPAINPGKCVFVLSILTHLLSSWIFYYEYRLLIVGERLYIQFYILILISLILSLFIYFSKEGAQKVILIILKYMAFFLIGYPLGGSILIEIILFFGIIFETVFILDERQSIIILFIFNIVFLLTQKQASAWYTELEATPLYKLISAGGLNLFHSGCAFTLKAVYKRSSAQLRDLAYMNSAITKLSDINIGFQNFVKEQEFNILLEERKRVSREIHDTVGYTLTNIIMMMEVLNVAGEDDLEKRKFIINNTKEQALNGLRDTRAALRALRKKDVPQKHGNKMIYELVSAFRLASGIDISLDFGNMPDSIDFDVDRIIFRFVQEGMTNVFRHGMATRIRISFWVSDKQLQAVIWDNGIGAAEIVEGIGLAGMRERLQKVNGRLGLENVQDGFKAEIIIPLERETGKQNAED